MKMKFGIGLMALGVGVWAAWSGWTRTRNVDPVDRPLAMAVGQSVSESFKLNYDGLYLIEIVAERTTTSEAQLLAVSAEWSLWSCGQEVKEGNTSKAHSAPSSGSGVVRVMGEFPGRAGHSYELQLKFAKDVHELDAAKPRLKVVVSGLARENLQAARVLLFSVFFICEMFGTMLVGVGVWGKRAAKREL